MNNVINIILPFLNKKSKFKAISAFFVHFCIIFLLIRLKIMTDNLDNKKFEDAEYYYKTLGCFQVFLCLLKFTMANNQEYCVAYNWMGGCFCSYFALFLCGNIGLYTKDKEINAFGIDIVASIIIFLCDIYFLIVVTVNVLFHTTVKSEEQDKNKEDQNKTDKDKNDKDGKNE
jgi:hypothetical protein